MGPARQLQYSYDDYRRARERSQIKLEYSGGDIHAMAGGTPAHAELAVNVAAALKAALKSGCSVFSSDLAIRIDAADVTTHPDLSVVCGERIRAQIDQVALTNPTVLVEVTSRSTELYDRNSKLEAYKHLPSLQGVLFVSHRKPSLTLVRRTSDGWESREYVRPEAVPLPGLDAAIAVDDVFRGVVLETDS